MHRLFNRAVREIGLSPFNMSAGAKLDTLQQPSDPKVQRRMLAPERVAMIRFRGLAQEKAVTSQSTVLQSFIVAHQLHVPGAGPV